MSFKKAFTYIFLIVVGLVIVAIAVLGPGRVFILSALYLEGVDRTLDRKLGSKEETITLSDQSFRMPIEYFTYATKGDYAGKAIINLEYIWPSFLPKRLASTEELNDAESNQNVGRFWIVEATHKNIAEALTINPNPKRIVKSEESGNFDGFQRYQHHEKMYGSDNLRMTGESFILKDANGKITDAIYCFESISKHPDLCEYSFIDGSILYKVTFVHEKHLQNWRSWKTENIKFLNSFRVDK
jgi:hypothetical protein